MVCEDVVLIVSVYVEVLVFLITYILPVPTVDADGRVTAYDDVPPALIIYVLESIVVAPVMDTIPAIDKELFKIVGALITTCLVYAKEMTVPLVAAGPVAETRRECHSPESAVPSSS